MSERAAIPREELPDDLSDDRDPSLERIIRDRLPGEIESGMMTGSDEAEISATERFEGDLTEDEALEALVSDRPAG